MSTPTPPREAQLIAFSTITSFWRAVNVRSIIRISPAVTCGYSRLHPRAAPRHPPQVLSRRYLRVLEARAVEAAHRREDDVVEVPLAAAVPLHRVEAQLER